MKPELGDLLTGDQVQQHREAFYLIDKNSDGLITMQDLAALLQYSSEHLTKEEINEIISEFDGDHEDETINFEEFLNIVGRRRLKENVGDEMKEAFKVFDRDQDGYISANELRYVMMHLGERLTDEEVQQMIKEADLDGDGLVSYEEFTRVMTIL